MYTADPELCEELYKLSGWIHPVVLVKRGIPLYDLGYLIRRLPPQTKLFKARTTTYGAYIGGVQERYKNYADTPEDAAAKLAIELFKQGILKVEK